MAVLRRFSWFNRERVRFNVSRKYWVSSVRLRTSSCKKVRTYTNYYLQDADSLKPGAFSSYTEEMSR